MLVSIRRRLAYLAVPKTGSQALESVLAPKCDLTFGGKPRIRHMNMKTFERFVLPYLRSLDAGDVETFCVVRAPIDWLGSWYRYRSREGLKKTSKMTKNISFAEFVEAYLETSPPRYANLRPMSSFVIGNSGKPAVTHIFRYDELAKVTGFLSQRFRSRIELPRINVSPPGDLTLPAALVARLETERPADFELYAELAR
jgi:hypothetical protein